MRVTNARGGESYHNFDAAYDVTLYEGGSRIQRGDHPAYTTSGNIGRSFGLEWGGGWQHPDMPHFQMTGGLTEVQMRARYEAGRDIYTGR
jgi:peptidoglycan L-alanyl-D-glutamate endopeptidase CwlK